MSFIKIEIDSEPLVVFVNHVTGMDVSVAASHFDNNPNLIFVTMFCNRKVACSLRYSVTSGKVTNVQGEIDVRQALLRKHSELDAVLRRVFENYVPVSIKPLFIDDE
jgi:hypothetical protein